jgi:Zn-dependent metalloprotease
VASSCSAGIEIDTEPTVSPGEAVDIARRDRDVDADAEAESDPFTAVYRDDGRLRLAWILTLPGWAPSMDGSAREPARWKYFIDAHDGEVITRHNLVFSHTATTGKGQAVKNLPRLAGGSKTINTYHKDEKSYQLRDTTRKADIIVYDAAGALSKSGAISEDMNNDWDDTTGMASTDHAKRIDCQAAEVDALDHIGRTYDYYKAAFNRKSIDDNEMDVEAYVHLRAKSTDGTKTVALNNAFWAGDHMKFGDGQYNGLDGDYGDFTFFSGALDIVAHELTHGVISYEHTDSSGAPAGFTYYGEPGAVEESFADVFAAFVDRDWRQGDEIVVGKLTAAGKMWRDLSNPTRGLNYKASDSISQMLAKGVPQPDHYTTRYQGTDDYGGVHINSGILNFAAYLAIHGGVSTRPGRTPVDIPVYRDDRLGIGWERGEQIWYLALTQYIKPLNPTFQVVRQALIDACDQLASDGLHGVSSCDADSIRTAFYAVGLQPSGTTYGADPTITPWGIWTGTGHAYQSPDVWVADATGKHVNAEKGVKNRLFARVRNIGDKDAAGVKVRFAFSPFGMGYQHKHFQLVDEKSVDLKAGEIKEVEVSWDLTNLTDTFAGKWPEAIDRFDHFCVRVELEPGEGENANACNDAVQHNFANVGTGKPANVETSLVIANPFETHGADIVIKLATTFPETWEAWLDGVQPDEVFPLEENEARVATLRVDVPDEPWIRPPLEGTVRGELTGLHPAAVDAQLTDVDFDERRRALRGSITGSIRIGRRLSTCRGELTAELRDDDVGDFVGEARLIVTNRTSRESHDLVGSIRGRLTPARTVLVSEEVDGTLVGGVELSLHQARP